MGYLGEECSTRGIVSKIMGSGLHESYSAGVVRSPRRSMGPFVRSEGTAKCTPLDVFLF